METLKSINSRIRFVMESLGYDEPHFSRRVGVSASAISHVVNQNEDPSYALLRNITTVFPVSQKWLMLGDGKPWTSDNLNKWKSGNKDSDSHREVDKGINDRFKEFRIAMDLSQTLLAAELGVTRDIVSNIETYRVSPTIQMLIILDKKHGMNVQWLLYGDGKMRRGGS